MSADQDPAATGASQGGAGATGSRRAGSHGTGEPPQPKTAGEMLAMARSFLERKQIEESRLEAELLVAHALGVSRLGLFMALERPLSRVEVDGARDALVRRGKREPVAYITGSREFYGRDFAVAAGVLIPRPETELLVDLARERCAQLGTQDPLLLSDLGTGSGCLAITLDLEIENARLLAADISPSAALQARHNAQALGASVEVLVGDGFDCLLPRGPFHGVVSNPPYVMRSEEPSLAPEVRDFEPELALYAPDGDPDHWVRKLLEHMDELLLPGGFLFVELGAAQGPRVLQLAQQSGREARLHKDLARLPRVLEVTRGT
ncbi:MAG: release factor glutamine methyltransferase [Candidatus Paceibacteria bacterium]|jgi:release factor glutamine methyltransferase